MTVLRRTRLEPIAIGEIYEPTWAKRACGECGREHLMRSDDPGLCFDCRQDSNAFAKKNILMSVDAEGEASPDIRRLRDGTSGINLGLPGVKTQVGTHPDGRPKYSYRPVTHNELPTKRSRRNYAERNGMRMLDQSNKRAVGGKK